MTEAKFFTEFTEKANMVLGQVREMRTQHLEELSQLFNEKTPNEWKAAKRFLNYVRRKFPNSDLAIRDDVSIFRVLKLYKMTQEQRESLVNHLPGYYFEDKATMGLFERIFATLRELGNIGDQANKSNKAAS